MVYNINCSTYICAIAGKGDTALLKRSEYKILKFKVERVLKAIMVCMIVVASCCANPVVAYTNKPQKVVTEETKIQPVVTKNVKIQPANTLMHLVNKKQNVKKVTAIQVAQEQEAKKEQGWIYIHGDPYRLSEYEKNLLLMVVYAESGGSTVEERMATTETILNRVATKRMSLTQVIFEKGQFACARNGNIYTGMGESLRLMTPDRVSNDTAQSVEAVLYAKSYITEALLTAEAIRVGKDPEVYAKGGALYFCELSGCSEKEKAARANIAVKIQIGDHIYYKVWDK